MGLEAVSISSPHSFKGSLRPTPCREPLRNHCIDLLFLVCWAEDTTFFQFMLCFLTFVPFLSLFICGTPLRPSRSVPRTSSELSPWGPPPSRRAIRSEAQVQSYQRGTGPCSQRHDLSLRGSWGATLCPSNMEVCLLTVVPTFPWASRSSSVLPPGLVLKAFLCCVCDCVTE